MILDGSPGVCAEHPISTPLVSSLNVCMSHHTVQPIVHKSAMNGEIAESKMPFEIDRLTCYRTRVPSPQFFGALSC